MIKNSLMKFIDSCVGNIARKIEDEFRESDHPRDKGGKFTSKGGEGRGGGGLHHAGKDVEEFGNELGKRRGGVIEKQKSRRGKSELEGEESSSSKTSSSSSGGLSKGQRELASHVFNAIMTEAVGQNDFDSAEEARDYVRGYIEMMLDDSEGLAENYGISEKEAVAAIKHANKSWKSSAQYKYPWESSYEDPYEEDDDEQLKSEHEQEEERMRREEEEADRARRTEWDR